MEMMQLSEEYKEDELNEFKKVFVKSSKYS